MENLKESNSLKIFAKYNKTSETILFFINKNVSEFKNHSYLISKNLTEEYRGTFKNEIFLDLYGTLNSGICLDLRNILDSKQFKMEFFK